MTMTGVGPQLANSLRQLLQRRVDFHSQPREKSPDLLLVRVVGTPNQDIGIRLLDVDLRQSYQPASLQIVGNNEAPRQPHALT